MDFQVRIEYENDELVYNFNTREAAEQGFREKCEQVREWHDSDDIHVELIEVLRQERIEPTVEEGNPE